MYESQLPNKIASNKHTITVEFSPPKGTDVSKMLAWVEPIRDKVDAINVPDCQRAILKMSSMVAAYLIQEKLGVDTVWQLTGRDRNLLALQSDLMGGWALGLHTILGLTGDPVAIGDQADVAKQVSHLDALRLIELVRTLNDGKDANGRELKRGGTHFCYGAALNPHRMSREAQMNRLQYKLSLGVQFFQTQPVYDVQTVIDTQAVIKQICEEHRYPIPKLMVGIIPPKSGDFARFMNQKIPGVEIPESFINILDKSSDPIRESIHFCADVVNAMAPHAGGFHFMPVGMERHSEVMLDACFGEGKRTKHLKLV